MALLPAKKVSLRTLEVLDGNIEIDLAANFEFNSNHVRIDNTPIPLHSYDDDGHVVDDKGEKVLDEEGNPITREQVEAARAADAESEPGSSVAGGYRFPVSTSMKTEIASHASKQRVRGAVLLDAAR